VHALKPVISGFDAMTAPASDSALLLDALGKPLCDEAIAAISPWRYAAPLSPNMAASAEGRSIDLDEVVAFCRQHISAAAEATVLIEGVGGLMVPLDERRTVLDWIAQLNVPTLLIAGSYLGAISHTLTCVEVLRSRGLSLAAILVNESPDGVALQPTVDTIAAFAAPSAVVALRRAAGDSERNAVYVIGPSRGSSSSTGMPLGSSTNAIARVPPGDFFGSLTIFTPCARSRSITPGRSPSTSSARCS
jgi:dethiobiotin synthetase